MNAAGIEAHTTRKMLEERDKRESVSQCTHGFRTIKIFMMAVEGRHSAFNDVSAVAGD